MSWFKVHLVPSSPNHNNHFYSFPSEEQLYPLSVVLALKELGEFKSSQGPRQPA